MVMTAIKWQTKRRDGGGGGARTVKANWEYGRTKNSNGLLVFGSDRITRGLGEGGIEN